MTTYPHAFRPALAVCLAALSCAPGAQAIDLTPRDEESSVRWLLIGPALTYHQQRTHANRPYNESNPGLGIGLRVSPLHERWTYGYDVFLGKDSFDKSSLFLNFAMTRKIWGDDQNHVAMGFQVGAAYKNANWEGPRRWRPLAALVSTVKLSTGLHTSLSYAYHQNATTGRTNGVFALQIAQEF